MIKSEVQTFTSIYTPTLSVGVTRGEPFGGKLGIFTTPPPLSANLALQHYSQSHRPHHSRPFHDFAWYNSLNSHKPWMEPLAGMGLWGRSNRENAWPAALWIALLVSQIVFVETEKRVWRILAYVNLLFFKFASLFPLLRIYSTSLEEENNKKIEKITTYDPDKIFTFGKFNRSLKRCTTFTILRKRTIIQRNCFQE